MVAQLFVTLLFVAYAVFLMAFVWWALVAHFGSDFLQTIRTYLRERKDRSFRIKRKT